ncbi:MAG: 50S ribosomal protein L14 [Caldisphaera sp.]|jgi:large subunit ribosomal protein L14|nr:50S ribosomal protein L14 [Caldisphaera sp.]PMP59388.1 MAG: 50S ribosomal protein L14 [Caldisphaera sp.]
MPKKKKYGAVLSRRGLSAGLQVGTNAVVADNSGAKEAMIVDVPLVKTRVRRLGRATVGDLVVVTIKKGTPQVRKQISHAVVIRQKRPYRRSDGTWISFDNNAIVLVNPDGTPKGSEIRGAVPKEVAERWPTVAKLATSII